MFRNRRYYLIKLQYLGFRYHGWQEQPDVLTLERMVSRTLAFVLGHKNFKLLASGRTDAKVSANVAYVELFLDNHPLAVDEFLPVFNDNLPQDIRALSMEEVDKEFNIINAPKEKEYIYLFAHGAKNHPFAAPFMHTVKGNLDISVMKEAAQLFIGTYDFKNYAYKPNPETQTVITITDSEITKNTLYAATFFPDESFVFKVKGKGFKRHQIRLMMGTLFDVGEGKFDIEFIKNSLLPETRIKLERIAPASGLILNNVVIPHF